MTEFFKNSAAVALAGIIVGAFLTGCFALLNAWVMRNRDLYLKLWERFLDRRIAAHETIITLAITMRRMCPLGKVDRGEVIRAPQVMLSKEAFDNWLGEFTTTSGPATTWLSTAVKRELNFVQDYFVSLHTKLSSARSDDFPIIGSIVRQDFIELSSSLEKAAFSFFEKEARRRRLSDLADWHKYPVEQTTSRLEKTTLLSKWGQIEEAIQSRQGRP